MIVDAFVSALAWVFSGLGDLFGALTMPDWWASVDGALATLGTAAAGIASWVPVGDAVTVAGFVLACVGIGFGIRLVRIVASFFTAGGGSAG